MKRTHRIAAITSGVLLGLVGLTDPAGAAPGTNYGSKKPVGFVGGNGTAAWVSGDSGSGASDGKVLQLSSPNGTSYAGLDMDAIDDLPIADVDALSYDFQVTTANWTGGGGGSPRLVLELSDGGTIALNPVTSLTTGEWVHMDAIDGAVDSNSGNCGYLYQASWETILACAEGATVVDADIVNDSGWIAPLTVQVDNITLNDTVYSKPAKPGKR